MARQNHLVRRGDVYYFRQRVPADLVPLYGKREIKRSLKTSTRAEAIRRALRWQSYYADEFAHRRQAVHRAHESPTVLHALDDETITRLVNLWTQSCLEGDEHFYLEEAQHLDPAGFETREQALQQTLGDLREALKYGYTAPVHAPLTQFLHLARIEVDTDEIGWRRLERAFLKSTIQLTEARLRRMAGEVVEARDIVDEGRVLALPSTKSRSRAANTSGPTFDQMVDTWASSVLDRPEKAIEDMQTAVRQFRDLIGQGMLPVDVERDHVEHFCKYLLETKGLSWKTTEKRVSQIRSLYKRAVKARLLQDNPALHVEVPKPRNPLPTRLQYELDDLKRIFSSPIYLAGDRPSGGKGEAAAWLPMLALHTGARLEELAQLRLEDIGHTSGIDFIQISDEGPGQKLKNTGSRRRIPLHPNLLAAGFLRYVEGLRETGEERLFPELRQDSKGDWGGQWSKFWGKYARRTIGLDDKRKTFHSFRHTFKTACRHAGLTEEVHDALTGHSGGGVGRRYGRQSLQALSEAIARIEYTGVPVPLIEPPA